MILGPAFGSASRAAIGALLVSFALGCAVRGHIASPDEMAQLQKTSGLSASGKLTLSGPKGRFSARVVFGLTKPASLRIEIPAGTGLRFLLVARDGKLRAELPGDDAMFEGPATSAVMKDLFGIDLSPADLVAAVLGAPPSTLNVSWRFDKTQPSLVTMRGADSTKFAIALDDPSVEPPPATAFAFGPPRGQSWTIEQMSVRLGLRR
ncbi:MAG: hypothetical protein ABIR28_12045 [Vicinamibacteria bacterium]